MLVFTTLFRWNDAEQILNPAVPINILAPFQQGNSNSFTYNPRFPCASELLASTDQYDTLKIEYQEAFYGNEKDVPKANRSYGGREFKLKSKAVSNLPEFDPMEGNSSLKRPERPQEQVKPDFKFWQIVSPSPSRKEVVKWLEEQNRDRDMVPKKADPIELDQFSQVGLEHIRGGNYHTKGLV